MATYEASNAADAVEWLRGRLTWAPGEDALSREWAQASLAIIEAQPMPRELRCEVYPDVRLIRAADALGTSLNGRYHEALATRW
jgi:hypothetical protein